MPISCNHREQRVINEALIAMVPLSLLAKTYGMSGAALSRHRKNHISRATASSERSACSITCSRNRGQAKMEIVEATMDDFNTARDRWSEPDY